MGNINPEQASGAAIVAVKDAQAVPLNEMKAAARQFVEDIALIWLDILTAYGTNGVKTKSGTISSEMLEGLEPEIRIDVSDGNPYSKYAREQALENAMRNNDISFEEYVEALDEDSLAPKAKFQEILDRRDAQTQETPEAEPEEMTAGMPAEMTQNLPVLNMA